jgi:hypothetical protein
MLLIYTANNTSRLAYIAEVLFLQVTQVGFTITTNRDEFIAYNGPKINYSSTPISTTEIWIQPHTLLFETNIKQQQTECFNWQGLKAFFKTGGDIPFDIFAASFYLISRYEEYLPHAKDEYGRYAHINSLAYKEGFLNQPLVNLWMKEFEKVIAAKFSRFTFHLSRFTFTPTYDIDIAYAYKGKGVLRNVGGFYKDLFTGKFKQLAERANVYSGWKQDPFDTYAWLDGLHQQYKLQPLYFFLLAKQPKLYDKNVPPNSTQMRGLIQQLAAKYTTGIHPSWQSGDDERLLKEEINTLKTITGKPVTISRQHYIRMTLPGTYQLLIDNGIEEDHSMGYGSINGFRASAASSFYWYDVEAGVKTPLLINPYCYMEANSYFEQHYSAEQAADELQGYCNIVKAVNGRLITIFHNHFITEQPAWAAWRKMYNDFLQSNF